MLPIACLFSCHMPIRHPAELFAFAGLEDDEEGIERDLFLLLSKPGFQLLGQECRNHSVIAAPGAELKIETDVKVAGVTAGRARLGRCFGEVVERVEQLLVRRILLMTLNAVKELRSHV